MNARKKFGIFTIFLSLCILALFSSPSYATQKDVSLTAEEKAFIQQHPIIHLGVDPKFIPYEFFDKDGEYKGIAADYMSLLSKRTGLKFEVEKNLTWTQAYEKAVNKKLDVLPCVSKTSDREAYFIFSNPYYSFQRVIFINKTNSNIKKFTDLENKQVAVQENSSHHGFLKTHSSIRLSLYKTVDEALLAVSTGKEVAYVGNFATSSYLIKANGITNLKYIPIDSEEKQYLQFAVRNDWPILVSILNKGLADITEEEKIAIDNRWIGVEKKIDYGLIFKVAGMVGTVVVLILAVSFYWIVKLRREVEKRKLIEADLKIAKEEAEMANHIKSTFLARMSHEIRTPLNAITGMTYVMKKTDISTTQKIYLEKITRAAKDMLGIINDILDFSKIEAGKIDIERISFNLDEVLEQVVNIVSFKIEEQKIDFSMNKDADIPTFFWGDPKRLEQILLNLVNNALKFTQDGAVSLSVRLIANVKNDYHLQIIVKDTGIGMSSDQVDQLFTPFTQADSSISRRFGGTGLGLCIVKNLVEMMGGEISVFSELGEGSTFNIMLTLEADWNKDYEERKKTASVYFKNIRALVVEKSLFYTNLLKDYLNSFNMVVEFAQSEDRAISLMQNACAENGKPYNLLIVDYETPREGGIEFCNKLKQFPGIREIPKTILLLPLSHEELFDKLESAGLDFGITKPIVPSVLYNGILEIFKLNVMEVHANQKSIENEETLMVDFPYHVLVVEDNKTNQFIAKSILEQSGFQVSFADNGKEGYEYFLAHRDSIHLILMDLHMPVMNGFESTVLIRETDQEIPIVAMTADAITGVEEKCREIGIDHYISKPFEPEQFVGTIKEFLKPKKIESVMNADDRLNINPAMENEQKNGQKENPVVLDVNDGIRHVGGNKDVYQMIIQEYYKENSEVDQLLKEAIQEENYEQAVQIVHKIKSSSGSIGAKGLHEVASKLQKALLNNEKEEISALYQEFSHFLGEVLISIENYTMEERHEQRNET